MSFDPFKDLKTIDKDDLLGRVAGSIDARDRYGTPLLSAAIAAGRDDIACALIASGADVNALDSEARSPLHYAAIYRMPPVVQALISRRADPNALDKHGNGPLWAAALSQRRDTDYGMVSALIEAGADPRHKNRANRSVIDFAKQSNNAALLRACGESP